MRKGPALLTGAAGLLGQWLLQFAPRHGDVVALTHRRAVAGVASVTADLREAPGVAAAMAKVDPTLVVHAAYAKDRELVVDATRHVVDAANAVGAHVLFISTDAVFLGDGCARDEQSAPNATCDYGRWKASAESIVLDGADTAQSFGAVARVDRPRRSRRARDPGRCGERHADAMVHR